MSLQWAVGLPQNPEFTIQPDAYYPISLVHDRLQWLVHVGSVGHHPSRQTRIGKQRSAKVAACRRNPDVKSMHASVVVVLFLLCGQIMTVCLGCCLAVAVLPGHIQHLMDDTAEDWNQSRLAQECNPSISMEYSVVTVTQPWGSAAEAEAN